jgi:hypothetical protein
MNDESKGARKEAVAVKFQDVCARIILEELSTTTKTLSENIHISDGLRTEYLSYPKRLH